MVGKASIPAARTPLVLRNWRRSMMDGYQRLFRRGSIHRAMDCPEQPFPILTVVGFDQELVVALVERDGDLHRIEFLGMIERGHLLPIEVDDRPVVQAETEPGTTL